MPCLPAFGKGGYIAAMLAVVQMGFLGDGLFFFKPHESDNWPRLITINRHKSLLTAIINRAS